MINYEMEQAVQNADLFSELKIFRYFVESENWKYLSNWEKPEDLSVFVPMMFPKKNTRGAHLLGVMHRCESRWVVELFCKSDEQHEDLTDNDQELDQGIEYLERKLGMFAEFYCSVKPRPSKFIPNSFYQSKEWLELRARASEYYKGKCAMCGISAKQGAIIQCDHIKPKYRYPELALEFSNLQLLCRDCNVGKSDLFITDWR